jgi:hypothetical protein
VCDSDTTRPLDGVCLVEEVPCLDDGSCFADLDCVVDDIFAGRSSLGNAALRWLYRIAVLVLLLPVFGQPRLASAAVYAIDAGDVAGLIAAIEAANADPDPDTINLEAGDYILTAPCPLGEAEGEAGLAGLPAVSSPVAINGSTTGTTTIRRDPTADNFSIFHVTVTPVEVAADSWEDRQGDLTLQRLVIQGGKASFGAGIFNEGAMLTLVNCTVHENLAVDDDNFSCGGAGIGNLGGTLTVIDSTISDNTAVSDEIAAGGGIEILGGAVSLRSTTLSGNLAQATETAVGGAMSGAADGYVNVTVSGNQAVSDGPDALSIGGGLFGASALKNSIVARNNAAIAPDVWACGEASAGHNVFGDLTGAFLTAQATDLVADPGLEVFTDSGAAGSGRLPVLAGSPAIDSGDPAACPPQDQLGQARVNICERGAVEYTGAGPYEPPSTTEESVKKVPALGVWGLLVFMIALAGLALHRLMRTPALRRRR